MLNRLCVAMALIALSLVACSRPQEAGRGATVQAAKSADAGERFLAGNARQPGVITLASGLQYKIVRSGPVSGDHPQTGDEIKVTYTGSLVSGDVFDSTNRAGAPAVMKLQDLVPGWMQALPKMRPGDDWILYMPPNLGYGPDGRPPAIPPNSVLVFELQLLGVLHTHESVKLAAGADRFLRARLDTVGATL